METRTQIHLGASMYSPTTQDAAKLVAILQGVKRKFGVGLEREVNIV